MRDAQDGSSYAKLVLLLDDGPKDAARVLVLAHGAGAPMDSPFMQGMAERLVARGVRVVRFEFPYMERVRHGERRPPDRMPALEARFREVVASLGVRAGLCLGGKSMGARVATQLADELGAQCALAFGYPFHPAKKPEQLRTAHLKTLRTPCLIVQGTRDPLGLEGEVAGFGLSASVDFHWIEDGDHSLEPRKASGRSRQECWDEAADVAAQFMLSLVHDSSEGPRACASAEKPAGEREDGGDWQHHAEG